MISIDKIRQVHDELTAEPRGVLITNRRDKVLLRIIKIPPRTDDYVMVGTYTKRFELADFIEDVRLSFEEFRKMGKLA